MIDRKLMTKETATCTRRGLLHRAPVCFLAACAAGMLFATAANAQESEPINAERPGFSSSPIALAPNLWQLEGGYQFSRDSDGADFKDHTLPLALLRYGLKDKVELQLAWAGWSRTEVGNLDLDGANDASIGVKWQVTDDGARAPVALFAGLSLPIGKDEFSTDEFDPTVGVFWSYSASLDWFGTVLLTEADDDTSISNAVGISIPMDESTGAYVEYFGTYGARGGSEHYLNGGFTYLLENNFQADFHAGFGLNTRSTDSFFGIGLAYRF